MICNDLYGFLVIIIYRIFDAGDVNFKVTLFIKQYVFVFHEVMDAVLYVIHLFATVL